MRKFLLLWLLAGVVPLGTAGPVQGGEQTLKVGRNVVYGEPAAAFVDGVMVQPERKGAGVERLTSLGTIRGFTPSAYLEDIQSGSIRLEQSNPPVFFLRLIPYVFLVFRFVLGRTR